MSFLAATSAGDAVDAIVDLYATCGKSHYDEVVTQAEHALQSAALAEQEGATPALVAAALLHDIGHLALDEHARNEGFLATDRRHEVIGAAVLERWFGPDVIGPIRLHVPAKRYLCAIDPEYAAGLSAASVRSLEVQGGAMTAAERAGFAAEPANAAAVQLRRWDDRAKRAGVAVPSFESYRTLLESLATDRI